MGVSINRVVPSFFWTEKVGIEMDGSKANLCLGMKWMMTGGSHWHLCLFLNYGRWMASKWLVLGIKMPSRNG